MDIAAGLRNGAVAVTFLLGNVVILPYVAHHLRYIWWAYLIKGIFIGILATILTELFVGVATPSGSHQGLWVFIDAGLILLACLRLLWKRL